ncbi:CUB and LDL domains-containing trypsin-like serine peptidase 1 protein, partial [Dinothrombium tinctorium]
VLLPKACQPGETEELTSYAGFIYSPGFLENKSYPEGIECRWMIKSQADYQIHLKFNSIDLDEMTGCKGDALKISERAGERQTLLSVFCGNHIPNDVITNTNVAVIVFRSDYVYSGRGFNISYRFTTRSTPCSYDQVQCVNRKCIPYTALCNGVDECGDGSDESNCRRPISTNISTCGTPPIAPIESGSERVVGGQYALEGSWPWQVSLQIRHFEPSGHTCGGALISPEYVLTAAHCVKDLRIKSFFKLVFGRYSQFKPNGNEQVRYIKNYIVYPNLIDYKFARLPLMDMDNDFALIRLSSPVRITDQVQPICLPPQGSELPLHSKCFATGWGATKGTGSSGLLKQLDVYVENGNDLCKTSLMESYPNTKICISSRNRAAGVCSGDSGGPLVCKENDGKWYLRGIASHTSIGTSVGPVCGVFGFGESYAKVSLKVNWIEAAMKVLNSV